MRKYTHTNADTDTLTRKRHTQIQTFKLTCERGHKHTQTRTHKLTNADKNTYAYTNANT